MKKTLIVVLFALFFVSASAQFQKGRKIINLGVGNNPEYFGKGVPIFFGFEYGIVNWLSVGPAMDLMMGNHKDVYSYYSYIGVCPGARLAFHLSMIKVKNLDVYGGISAGVRKFLIPDMSVVPEQFQNGNYVYGFAGARYRIVKHFGCFMEASSGMNDPNFLRAGISFMSTK